ncbi:MAG: bifunctional UDP-N-acetylglucosamine diphosphorylase/glucosamine-1-phosphate N-acetyltransferase GlmU [Acidobacteria bacterium]|jgi:bifunctional UDP-N-acetylglucosamine pyrophosphorylase/glucosamine-1-phosphate N-acetyltransferase|nr:bifunctional UDP-N-acetylglucosamine diphosphorylase/glucosamine-1-phosphate N-acetyltransferase GlmU [Acidobacteriota bacterium]
MENLSNEQRTLDVLILAAGLGTRMRSNLAKVLHKLDGRPLINHVCLTATALAPRKIYVVIGHQGEDVTRAVFEELSEEHAAFVWQKEQLGTGHAVNSAREFLETADSTLLILSGDVPMIRAETLATLVQQHHNHRGKGAACTILTVKLDEPKGYGRIVRDDAGFFSRIVEQKDASEEEKLIKEVNSGIYCFNTKKLFSALSSVQNNNVQGEYYLTDVPALLREAGEDISLYQHTDAREVSGINNRAELADLERIISRRTISRMMSDYGVSFIDPKNTYVSESANIGRDTVIYPNVTIEGETIIGDGCTIRQGTRITNSRIGRNVEILDNCVITDSEISDNCTVGPFAHLRGKAKMEESAKVGNFVELKKTILGRGSKASHLTYLGDATIGEKTNIGAGTITCNYDGVNKHATIIEDNVKIGSDTMLVAPVRVGSGSVTGAGSVVTKDVPPDSLVAGVPATIKKNFKEAESETGRSESNTG